MIEPFLFHCAKLPWNFWTRGGGAGTGQPERIIFHQSVSSVALTIGTVMDQALGNTRDRCSTTVFAIMGHWAFLSEAD